VAGIRSVVRQRSGSRVGHCDSEVLGSGRGDLGSEWAVH